MVKRILQSLSRKEITLDEAARELDTAVRTNPGEASTAMALLRVARGARQLDDVGYSRLYNIAQGALRKRSSDETGGQNRYSQDEPDETVIANPRQQSASSPAQGGDETIDDEAETVIASSARRPPPSEADDAPGDDAPAGDDPAGNDYRSRHAGAPAEDPASGRAGPATRASSAESQAPPSGRENAGFADEDDEEEEDDDDDDAPTVIARLARSRFAASSAAAEAEAEKEEPAAPAALPPQGGQGAGSARATPGASEPPDAPDEDADDDEEDEDEDEDEDAPTVIARLARSRYSSAVAKKLAELDQAEADGTAEPEGTAADGSGAGAPGHRDQAEGASARGSTPAREQAGANRQRGAPTPGRARRTYASEEGVDAPVRRGGVETPARDTAAGTAARTEPPEAERAGAADRPARAGPPQRSPAASAPATSASPPADAGDGDDDDEDDDEEAPTVIARVARQRYSEAAQEIGREPAQEQPRQPPPSRRGPAKGRRKGPQATPPGQAHPKDPPPPSDDTDFQPTIEDPEKTMVAPGTPPPAAGDRGASRPTTAGGTTGDTDSSSSQSSQQSWTPPGGSTAPELKGLGPGSVIKDRFVLEKVLGAGGMGKVYQASDQLKVEAHDRNPHVALKVLTEDFKEHPEAFIALQREASRQQKLAHPNIATVYDFDRIGSSGTQVFITMELMEGYPLNTYIKKIVRPRGGLSPEEAIPMIRQLGAALAYAHKRDIVHSDFKPGNAFLCDDGTMKVLDFGIARAVKAPSGAGDGQEEEGAEKTYFDPGELGALTPAYASLEMLQGEAPDPRDDLYALACVAYELFTGYHPFNRKSAQKAKENKLVPAPVKSLKRRQMRGLLRGLAFEREHRTADVEAFVEEIEGRLNWHKNPYVIGGALAVALSLAAIGPVLDLLDERRINQMVAEVQSGEPERIETILTDFHELDATARTTIADEGREQLQSHFESRIHAAVNLDERRFDFARAEEELARAEAIYPDSAAIIRLAEFIDSARDRRLHELNQQLIAGLEGDRLLPEQEAENESAVPTVLGRIEDIDGNHALLEDPRIPSTYASAAQGSINTGDLGRAEQYLATGERLARGDIDLLNTRARLEAAEESRQRSERVAELREHFQERINGMDDLSAFQEAEAGIVELARLAPADGALAALREVARPIASERIDDLAETPTAAAYSFVERYETVLEALDLHGLLLEAKLYRVAEQEREQERERVLARALEELSAALDEPSFDRDWEAAIRNELRYLQATLPADSAELEQARAAIAAVYVERAEALRSDRIYSEALALLERAQAFDLEQDTVAEAYASIDEAQTEFLREREEAARQARIDGLRETLLIQARARELDAARETFSELQREVPEDDPFLNITAPNALGEAFADVAADRASDGDYHEALAIAERGLGLAPDARALNDARQNYTVEVNTAELDRLFREEIRFDTSRAARMVDEIRTWAPARYSRLESEYVDILATRIREIGAEDRQQAERLATRASNIFPGSTRLAELREEVAPRPWPEGSAARASLSAGRLNEAQAILERALRDRPDHPEVQNFQENLEDRLTEAEAAFARFREAMEAEELPDARGHLADARSLWVDNREFREAQSELSEQIALQRRRQSRVLQRTQDLEGLREAAEVTGRDVVGEDWDPIPSNRPCSERVAGYGTRARAICYDLIHDRVRGPLMVVVPPSENHDSFAISKYEISHEDYNKYCFLSGNCPVDDDVSEDLPRTRLSIAEIQEYTEWLSERTGKGYRLPTRSEWAYAAYANGQQPPRDFNCRVMLGNQALKGTNLVDVTVGHQNGWGLKNYIGNSQEIVNANGELVAMGGSYRDPHSECSIEFQRTHDGSGDAVTGFRLILEDVPQDIE